MQDQNNSKKVNRHIEPFAEQKKKTIEMENIYSKLETKKQRDIKNLEKALGIVSQRKKFLYISQVLNSPDVWEETETGFFYREDFFNRAANENIDLNELEYYLAAEMEIQKQKDLALRYLSKMNRINDCGDFLKFETNLTTNKKCLIKARFCRIKLCPMCEWRRILKLYSDLSVVLDELKTRGEFRLLFLTLTIKNVVASDLKTMLYEMQHGLQKMQKRKFYLNAVRGSFESLEITHNWKEDTYHPHFHLVLVVDKNYFNQSYIPFEIWKKEWQIACGLSYKPQVYIEAVQLNNEIVTEVTKSILEVINMTSIQQRKIVKKLSNYVVKGNNFTVPKHMKNQKNRIIEAVETLDEALHKKHFYVYRGILKIIFNDLKVVKKFNQIIFPFNEDVIHMIYFWHSKTKNYRQENIMDYVMTIVVRALKLNR